VQRQRCAPSCAVTSALAGRPPSARSTSRGTASPPGSSSPTRTFRVVSAESGRGAGDSARAGERIPSRATEEATPPSTVIPASLPVLLPVPLGATPPATVRPPTVLPQEDTLIPKTWRLTFADGQSFEATSSMVLGRDPAVVPVRPQAQRIPVADPAKSVSKTHAIIDLESAELSVTDLHSTNGVIVTRPDGRRDDLPPGGLDRAHGGIPRAAKRVRHRRHPGVSGAAVHAAPAALTVATIRSVSLITCSSADSFFCAATRFRSNGLPRRGVCRRLNENS
jgi:FHA domain